MTVQAARAEGACRQGAAPLAHRAAPIWAGNLGRSPAAVGNHDCGGSRGDLRDVRFGCFGRVRGESCGPAYIIVIMVAIVAIIMVAIMGVIVLVAHAAAFPCYTSMVDVHHGVQRATRSFLISVPSASTKRLSAEVTFRCVPPPFRSGHTHSHTHRDSHTRTHTDTRTYVHAHDAATPL